MPDIAAIATILSSLKTATDIAKFLRETDLSMERAELKLKLADLIGALADTKMELADLQEVILDKDKHIAALEDAFQAKDTLIRFNDAMYASDADGNPTGVAFCLRCWETDHQQRQLVSDPSATRLMNICTACGHKYQAGHSYKIDRP